MPYKTDLEQLPPGNKFYFPNDPQLLVWVKTKEKRTNEAKQVFFYCECTNGTVEDFNQNRNIIAFGPSENPIPEPPDHSQHNDSSPAPEKPPVSAKTKSIAAIKHTESAVVIYQTKDYSLFKMMDENREINNAKIKKIIKQIDAGNDVLQYCPALVKERDGYMFILDGQHRYTISKILKRPVYYVIVTEDKSMMDIAKVNSNTEKWRQENYINCYTKTGNKNYEVLQAYRNLYGFSVGICLNLLTYGEPGAPHGNTSLHQEFESGDFEVKTYTQAVDFGDIVKKFEFFSNWKSRDFVIAIYKIVSAKKVSINDVVAAVEKNKEMLVKQGNDKEYIFKIESIMNIGKKNRIVIV